MLPLKARRWCNLIKVDEKYYTASVSMTATTRNLRGRCIMYRYTAIVAFLMKYKLPAATSAIPDWTRSQLKAVYDATWEASNNMVRMISTWKQHPVIYTAIISTIAERKASQFYTNRTLRSETLLALKQEVESFVQKTSLGEHKLIKPEEDLLKMYSGTELHNMRDRTKNMHLGRGYKSKKKQYLT